MTMRVPHSPSDLPRRITRPSLCQTLLTLACLVGTGAGAEPVPQTALNEVSSSLVADFAYTRGSGNGGYASNALSVNLEHAAVPFALGLEGTQSMVDGVESSTQLGASLKWRVSRLMSVTAKLASLSDDTIHVNGRGVSVAWNLHRLWQSPLSTRLEVGRDVNDYSLQSGAIGLSSRIPQQQRTTLDFLQGLTPSLDLYANWEWLTYSKDPVDLARALLTRKVRRLGLASQLGNLTDQGVTLGLGWSLNPDWNLDLSAGQSRTVVGQGQRVWGASLSYAFHPKASVSMGYSTSRVDALLSATGQTVSPQQDDATIELGLKWLY